MLDNQYFQEANVHLRGVDGKSKLNLTKKTTKRLNCLPAKVQGSDECAESWRRHIKKAPNKPPSSLHLIGREGLHAKN